MSKIDNLSRYSPLALRAGIAIVFLWFGFSQLKNPASWTRLMPEYIQSMVPLSANTLVYINGVVEIVLAILLLLGLFTRTTSALLTLHLLHITTIVGYGAVGARDLALSIATLAIFFRGADEFCLDSMIFGEKLRKSMVPANRSY